ncbi:glutamine--fructose-6-phosphate transaminase (isomerizing) [Clostridium sp. D2Q-11]|uniref:Glutamine--fructose-6-phosphate aminotransferase [isomerizing] n=1 Tax=Anaeromonas frigoriresistens TaxID=2683708 RepID=A0A942UVJ0_9FIRM|nr:glutamine--fructose-6-phosphate transaminase (isomerizing) [Anaeromonas frigoriresistens]MBS4538285.1 glutamine--fructose-6-phosphate transaminase (isomerizing) [Anaeromonas frigoriresistens]
MCGIVGYIGKQQASNILVEGLSKLEYRGYDSAGVAILENDNLDVRKYKGRLAVLQENLEKVPVKGNIGIGHTRWATHGEPSDVNSHPHANNSGNIAVVHNGIIENYIEIKERLIMNGYKFLSETDTEVVAHLVDMYYEGDLIDAVQKAVKDLEGAYALGVINKENPDKLIAVRKDSPLIIGIGEDENFIASDIPAVLKYTRKIFIMEDGEMAIVKENDITLMKTDGTPVEKEVYTVNWDVEAAEKGGYDHFMLKEIYEQPKAVKDTLSPRLNRHNEIKLDDISLTKEDLERFNQVYIIACGTAYHAGLLGKSLIQKYVNVPVIAEVGSEFRYNDPFIDEKSLMIVVSQSGETADTLAALRMAKERGARTLAVTNVVGSTISREADDVFYTWAGPEIAVASTKAYTTQLVSLALIALDMANKKGTISKEKFNELIEELRATPAQIEEILKMDESIKDVAKVITKAEHIFYIGRGIDYDVAREGSLKLKEISYIHSEAMAAGELKHGTIALIEDGTPVIALATQDRLYDKTVSNIKEVNARGAKIISLAKAKNTEISKSSDHVMYIPDISDDLSPILSVVPLQILAYHVATLRGADVDKPRNLAKSVTVE